MVGGAELEKRVVILSGGVQLEELRPYDVPSSQVEVFLAWLGGNQGATSLRCRFVPVANLGTPVSRSKNPRKKNPRFEAFEGFPLSGGNSPLQNRNRLGSNP